MSDKSLEYYLANPDELPTDVESLEKLAEQMSDGEVKEEVAEPVTEEAVEAPAEEDVTEEASSSLEGEETEAPIASRDGKHTIPYAVLATEREKRRAAEQVQQELMSRMAELEQRINHAGQQQAPQESQSVDEMLSSESAEAIVEDFPSLKPMLDYTKKLESMVRQFEDRFRVIEEVENSRIQQEQQKILDETRREIDANPVLRYWEAQDPEKWQAAVAANQQLLQIPISNGLSLKDRFQKVVAVVEAVYGQTELPAEFQPPVQPPKDLKQKVEKAVEKAESFRPKTLSEMPGGMAPKGDELEELDSLSANALAAKFAKMTPDAMNSLLAKLG